MIDRAAVTHSRRFEGAVALAIAPLGFRSHMRGIFTTPIATQVRAWLGLNRAVEGEHVEINPAFGIRHQQVEAIVAELTNRRDTGFHPPTVAASLGYLTPADAYQPLILRDDDNVAAAADSLADDLRRYALPFARANLDHASLVVLLTRPPFRDRNSEPYRAPVVRFLLGNTDEALSAP